MIVCKLELHSARTGEVTTLGRIHIANDGIRTLEDPDRGTYSGKSFRKGNPNLVTRTGKVEDYARNAYSPWTLLRKMLEAMGY